MGKRATTPTRVTNDIVETAASVAAAEERTTTEQVNYWARIGMQVERSGSLRHRRAMAAAAGEEQFSTLEPDERAVAHAVIDARIAERASRERFGPAARATGQMTVSIDDDGDLVEIAPDGTRRHL